MKKESSNVMQALYNLLAEKFRLTFDDTELLETAFTALLNCAEVGRRNRILTNYRFLSHSLLEIIFLPCQTGQNLL